MRRLSLGSGLDVGGSSVSSDVLTGYVSEPYSDRIRIESDRIRMAILGARCRIVGRIGNAGFIQDDAIVIRLSGARFIAGTAYGPHSIFKGIILPIGSDFRQAAEVARRMMTLGFLRYQSIRGMASAERERAARTEIIDLFA